MPNTEGAQNEKDINDVFDDILFAEEHLIEEGYKEGLATSLIQENTDAYHIGYHRGAEIGSELGYYSRIVDGYLDIYKGQSSIVADKITKKLETLKELITTFPENNLDNVDILGLFDNIRTYFKKVCALLKVNLLHPESNQLSF